MKLQGTLSALGHKPTNAPQKAMSALPLTATTKEDIRKRSCPLCTESRHVHCNGWGQLWAI